MTAVVKNPKGQTYVVKNLGWLLRHLSKSVAQRVEVVPALSDRPDGEQWVRAYFEDGYMFASTFSDPMLLKHFLASRSTLEHVSVFWHGERQPDDWQRLFIAQYLAALPW